MDPDKDTQTNILTQLTPSGRQLGLAAGNKTTTPSPCHCYTPQEKTKRQLTPPAPEHSPPIAGIQFTRHARTHAFIIYIFTRLGTSTIQTVESSIHTQSPNEHFRWGRTFLTRGA